MKRALVPLAFVAGVEVGYRMLRRLAVAAAQVRVDRAYAVLDAHICEHEVCGYCGVPPMHWPWCPEYPQLEVPDWARQT